MVVQEGLMEEPLVTPAFQRSSQWPGLGICMNIDWVLLRFLGGNRGEVMQSSPRELVFDGWTVEVLNTFKTRKKKRNKRKFFAILQPRKVFTIMKENMISFSFCTNQDILSKLNVGTKIIVLGVYANLAYGWPWFCICLSKHHQE